jgi:hypothetical protein
MLKHPLSRAGMAFAEHKEALPRPFMADYETAFIPTSSRSKS